MFQVNDRIGYQSFLGTVTAVRGDYGKQEVRVRWDIDGEESVWSAASVFHRPPPADATKCSRCGTPKDSDLFKGTHCPRCNDWC